MSSQPRYKLNPNQFSFLTNEVVGEDEARRHNDFNTPKVDDQPLHVTDDNHRRMFMTPREIMKNYSPLDADRYLADDAMELRGITREDWDENMYTGETWEELGNRYETDGDVWDRKLHESHDPPWKDDPDLEDKTLYEAIAQDGVKYPVWLGEETSEETGKPMVTGGHHRIASANDLDPTRLIPVLHSRDIFDAKSSGYQYR